MRESSEEGARPTPAQLSGPLDSLALGAARAASYRRRRPHAVMGKIIYTLTDEAPLLATYSFCR